VSEILGELRDTWNIEEVIGYNYLPFLRSSNNVLIPLFKRMEKWLGLRKKTSAAPWVLVRASKKSLA